MQNAPGTPNAPAVEPAAATVPAGTPAAAPAAPPASPPATGTVAPSAADPQDPAERIKSLEQQLAETRREAAGYRTQNKGELAEFKKAMAGALGLEGATAPPDAATLLAEFQKRDTQRETELQRMKVDLALGDVYTKLGVKPKLTRALLESDGVLAGLSPTDADFGKSLQAAVKKLADDYPELKAGPAPAPTAPRSGAAFPGGNPNATPQLTLEEVKVMKPEEVEAARVKGQLNQILGRRF